MAVFCLICTFKTFPPVTIVTLTTRLLFCNWAPLLSHLSKVELGLRSRCEVIRSLPPILISFLLTCFYLNLVICILNCYKDSTRDYEIVSESDIKLIDVNAPLLLAPAG